MSDRFQNNPAYIASEDRMRELHQLVAQGQGSSPDANRLRSEMEELWYQLDEREQYRLQRLSAELVMTYGTEKPRPKTRLDRINRERRQQRAAREGWSGREQHRTRKAVAAAVDEGHWDKVLDLLRDDPTAYPKEMVAWLRGRAYEAMGHLRTALTFFDAASAIRPGNVWFEAPVAAVLLKMGEREEGISRLERIAAADSTPPVVKIFAAAQMFLAERGGASDFLRLANRIVEIVTPVVDGPIKDAFDNDTRWIAQTLLANCYERLGDRDKAKRRYEKALQILPNDPASLTSLAHVLYDTNPDVAASLLHRAIEADIRIPGAAFLLCHYHLMREEYIRAKFFADLALAIPATPKMHAAVLAWRAIAKFAMGDRATIAADLQEAIRLAPDDARPLAILKQFNERTQSDQRSIASLAKEFALNEPPDPAFDESHVEAGAIAKRMRPLQIPAIAGLSALAAG